MKSLIEKKGRALRSYTKKKLKKKRSKRKIKKNSKEKKEKKNSNVLPDQFN